MKITKTELRMIIKEELQKLNEDGLREWKGFVYKFSNQLGKIAEHLRNSKSSSDAKKIVISLIKQADELNKKL